MVTVITHELLTQGDVNAIMESTGSEYVHVTSKAPKVSVINLGMAPENFKAFKPITALNVFGKQFSPATIQKLGSDICIVSDGVLSAEEYQKTAEKIGQLIGKMPIVGIGAGKDLLISTLSDTSGWVTDEHLMHHPALNLYGLDSYDLLAHIEWF